MPTSFEELGWLPENTQSHGQLFTSSDPSNNIAIRPNYPTAATVTTMYETLTHGQGGNTINNVAMDQKNNQMGDTTPAHFHQQQQHYQQQQQQQQQHLQNQQQQHQNQHHPHDQAEGSMGLSPWQHVCTPTELLNALMQPTTNSFPSLNKHEMAAGLNGVGGSTSLVVTGQQTEVIPETTECGVVGGHDVQCNEETFDHSASTASSFDNKIQQFNNLQ